MNADHIEGDIFEIQRFSIHDGPGIRTTVFLKGCPLNCVWCHNPEGINPKPLLSFIPDKCIGCGFCFRTCPNGAHIMLDGKHVLDRTKCKVCGACTAECYSGALELIGRRASVVEIIEKVLRDRPFYDTSGGGLTLSGGEPLMQIDFSEALLMAAKSQGLHCCIETSGFASFPILERIVPYVDLFLYDIKETDNDRHIAFTGVPNKLILKNAVILYQQGAHILLRLPIIPGYNDNQEHFQGVADLSRQMPNLVGVEVMPYHNLGRSKVDRLGLSHNQRENSKSPDNETINGWIEQFEHLGVKLLNQKRLN